MKFGKDKLSWRKSLPQAPTLVATFALIFWVQKFNVTRGSAEFMSKAATASGRLRQEHEEQRRETELENGKVSARSGEEQVESTDL